MVHLSWQPDRIRLIVDLLALDFRGSSELAVGSPAALGLIGSKDRNHVPGTYSAIYYRDLRRILHWL